MSLDSDGAADAMFDEVYSDQSKAAADFPSRPLDGRRQHSDGPSQQDINLAIEVLSIGLGNGDGLAANIAARFDGMNSRAVDRTVSAMNSVLSHTGMTISAHRVGLNNHNRMTPFPYAVSTSQHECIVGRYVPDNTR